MLICWYKFRSYLKKVFWPNFCVGPLLQLLGILQYACGLKFSPALNLNQNPFFEMASNVLIGFLGILSFRHLLPDPCLLAYGCHYTIGEDVGDDSRQDSQNGTPYDHCDGYIYT